MFEIVFKTLKKLTKKKKKLKSDIDACLSHVFGENHLVKFSLNKAFYFWAWKSELQSFEKDFSCLFMMAILEADLDENSLKKFWLMS